MNNSFKIALGLIIVGVVGGLAGILLAPNKGVETRDQIAKKGKKLWKKTKETANDLLDKSSDIKESVVKKAGKVF